MRVGRATTRNPNVTVTPPWKLPVSMFKPNWATHSPRRATRRAHFNQALPRKEKTVA